MSNKPQEKSPRSISFIKLCNLCFLRNIFRKIHEATPTASVFVYIKSPTFYKYSVGLDPHFKPHVCLFFFLFKTSAWCTVYKQCIKAYEQ